MILLKCDCGKTLQIPEGTAAKKGKCPSCGRVWLLPAAGDEPPAIPTLRATLRGHRGAIAAVAFSSDAKLLATAAGSEGSASPDKARAGEALVWDAVDGRPMATLTGHRDTIRCLAFSPDSQVLVSGSKDHTLGVWDVSRGLWDSVVGVREQLLRGHFGKVTAVAYRADGTLLASGSDDQTIRLWNTSSWQMESIVETGRRGACHLTFSPCGRYLAAVWSSRGPARVWDATTRQECLQLRLRSEEDFEDYGLAFSPDGGKLAVLSADEVRLWDLSSCQVLVSFAAEGVKSLASSPVDKLLATGGWEVATHVGIRLWDGMTGMPLHELQGHNLPVSAVAFSADGRTLASGSRDMTVKLWSLPAVKA